ncbi:type I 3-dehydroquinate dehydratase [Thiohalorhabdus methylotrophus]|uniref:3-dehydroquinate dehydratase n=1 Tax=Thiohalorhabdus methylotrophus TaxID=3242694 RepID=A0ABV4TWV0_9GAMM
MPRPNLIAALAYPNTDALPADGAARVGPADLVEVRLDAVEGGNEVAVSLCRTIAGWDRPLLLTPRSPGEGGMREWGMGERQAMLLDVWAAVTPVGVDVELRDSPKLLEWTLAHRPHGTEVIASYHNFDQFPGVGWLEVLALEAQAQGADRFKAAVRVDGPAEMADLACWTRERSKHFSLITMAVGEQGSLSRVMNGIFGSWACYAHIEEATAPGQLPVQELGPLLERFYVS